jgi:hypothetical protein
MKKIVALIFILFITSNHYVFASAPSFMPEKIKGDGLVHAKSSEGLLENFMTGLAPYGPLAINVFFKAVTLIFLLSLIVFAISLFFKNGQWQKWAMNSMILTLMVILIFRGAPILLFSSNIMGIDQMLQDFMSFTVYCSYFIGITLFLVGLLFRFTHQLIKHPDYYRWSKRLIGFSVLAVILSIVVPLVFLNV